MKYQSIAGLSVQSSPLCLPAHQSGLREKLESLKKKELDWLEKMDVTPAAVEASGASTAEAEGDRAEGLDPNDDFKREMHL